MEEISAQQLVERHSQQVFSLVARIVGNSEDAEEITQDTFLKVFRSIDKFRAQSSLSTWIYRIAYNCAISHCRKKKLPTTPLNEEITLGSLSEEIDFQREAQYVALERALAALPADEAALMNLYYWKDLSVEELAAITSLTQSNIKVKLHRIRGKLKKALNDGLER